MKIEDEIKQKKFSSEYEKLVVNLLFTTSWLSLSGSQRLKCFGISTEQFNVLRILRGQFPNPSSIQLIVDRMIDKSSNASRIVEKLRLKELIQRKESSKDRRLVDVTITEKGLALLAEVDKIQEEWMDDMKNLSKEEAAALNQLLDKLRG